jgi:hypothetical protein
MPTLLAGLRGRGPPRHARQSAAGSSLEAYKARRGAETPFDRGPNATPDTASKVTLRACVDVLVPKRIETVRYRTSKELVTKRALLLISVALFGFLWRWVRRMNAPSVTVSNR